LKKLNIIATLVAASAISMAAAADDKITLKFAHQFPANNHLWEEGGRIFADAVTQATDGKVDFEVYPASQLGKDQNALLKSGLADIVTLIPSYDPGKLALSSVVELPGIYSSSCEGTAKAWNLAQPGGLLDRDEYAPQGYRVLFVMASAPYKIMTKSKAVSNLDDLAGLKIRAGGAAMDKALRALGGTPIKLSGTELYDAFTRGTIDGTLFPYYAVPAFDLDKVVGHTVEGAALGAASIIYAMSNRSWNKLPDEMKAVFVEAGAKAQSHLCHWVEEDDQRVRDEMQASGVEIVQLSDEEAQAWKQRLVGVGEAWAQELDAAGRNGTELLNAMRNGVSP